MKIVLPARKEKAKKVRTNIDGRYKRDHWDKNGNPIRDIKMYVTDWDRWDVVVIVKGGKPDEDGEFRPRDGGTMMPHAEGMTGFVTAVDEDRRMVAVGWCHSTDKYGRYGGEAAGRFPGDWVRPLVSIYNEDMLEWRTYLTKCEQEEEIRRDVERRRRELIIRESGPCSWKNMLNFYLKVESTWRETKCPAGKTKNDTEEST